VLVAAVERAIDAGVLAATPARTVADALWALVHGMVSLELRGYFASGAIAEERFRVAGLAMIAGFRQTKGTERRSKVKR
jgi:hypothetical protein